MRAITRRELILLAGLSGTRYPERITDAWAFITKHSRREVEFVKKKGITITRTNEGGFRVVVGGPNDTTT